jgi:hypothetical protein
LNAFFLSGGTRSQKEIFKKLVRHGMLGSS